MFEHKVNLEWINEKNDFSYETYSRSHRLGFGGGIEVQASSAPEYLGKAEEVNPEELFTPRSLCLLPYVHFFGRGC